MSVESPFEDTIDWWVQSELRRLTRFFYDDDSMRGTPVGAIREAEIEILKTAPHDISVLNQMIEERKARRKLLYEIIDLQGIDAEIGMLQWIIATMDDCATRKVGKKEAGLDCVVGLMPF